MPHRRVRFAAIVFVCVLLASAISCLTTAAFGQMPFMKSCGRCGRQVNINSQVGDQCEHCGAYWGAEQREYVTRSSPSRREVSPRQQRQKPSHEERRAAKQRRREELKETIQRKLHFYREAAVRAREIREAHAMEFEARMDLQSGLFDWPSELLRHYPTETNRIHRLCQNCAAHLGGGTPTQIAEIQRDCDRLLGQMRRDLHERRSLSSDAYLRCKRFVIALKRSAETTMPVEMTRDAF